MVLPDALATSFTSMHGKRPLGGTLLTRLQGARTTIRRDAEDRVPSGINLAGGAVALVAAALLAATVPASHPGWRFLVLAAGVGGVAAVPVDALAVSGVALLAWVLTNGFLENRIGELSWHGWLDELLAMVLVLATVVGLAIGAGYRRVRELRAR